jgi:hypothetical protein
MKKRSNRKPEGYWDQEKLARQRAISLALETENPVALEEGLRLFYENLTPELAEKQIRSVLEEAERHWADKRRRRS